MARLLGLSMAACIAVCAAMPAYAHGSARNDPLRIEITATVAERCGLSASGGRTSASGDLQSAQSLRLEFDVDHGNPLMVGFVRANANPSARRTARSNQVGKPAAAGAAINGPAANAGSGAMGAQAAGHEKGDTICLFHGLLLGWLMKGPSLPVGRGPRQP